MTLFDFDVHLPSKADRGRCRSMLCFRPKATWASAPRSPRGRGRGVCWHVCERFCCLQLDHHFEVDRLHDGKISRLLSLRDGPADTSWAERFRSVGRGLMIRIHRKVAPGVARRYPVSRYRDSICSRRSSKDGSTATRGRRSLCSSMPWKLRRSSLSVWRSTPEAAVELAPAARGSVAATR